MTLRYALRERWVLEDMEREIEAELLNVTHRQWTASMQLLAVPPGSSLLDDAYQHYSNKALSDLGKMGRLLQPWDLKGWDELIEEMGDRQDFVAPGVTRRKLLDWVGQYESYMAQWEKEHPQADSDGQPE